MFTNENRNMNYRLFFLLILLEALALVVGAFALLLFFFMYFGSGASASSEKAQLIINITFFVFFSIPLLYGVFKYKKTEDKLKARSYLFAGFVVTIVSGIYFGISM